MAHHATGSDSSLILTQQLLMSVVEQMKLPLLHIARSAELAALKNVQDLETISTSAHMALRLLDSYALGVQLARQQVPIFEREPVSVSGVLYDAAMQLAPYAHSYGVSLDLQLDGKYGPVMAHRQGLQAALVSLGYAFIEALPTDETAERYMRLSAHRCRYGIVTGMYVKTSNLAGPALRIGRQLQEQGITRQPLNTFTHTSGAGIFVADALLRAMQTCLNSSRHRRLYGLGAVLLPNPQLRLV